MVLNAARAILFKAEKKKYDDNDNYNRATVSTKTAASKATTHKAHLLINYPIHCMDAGGVVLRREIKSRPITERSNSFEDKQPDKNNTHSHNAKPCRKQDHNVEQHIHHPLIYCSYVMYDLVMGLVRRNKKPPATCGLRR